MKIIISLSALALGSLIILNGCTEPVKEENTQPMNHFHHDPHSFSNPDMAHVTHLHWTAVVDFGQKSIAGTAEFSIETTPNADRIIFDIMDLEIASVEVDGQTATWNVGERLAEFGSPLEIPITEGSKKVKITYKTGPDAGALLWVDGEKPFLFTQSQAILGRTWIPCQDSPGVRYTYSAEVTVPKGLLALMSAENPQSINETGVYSFKMDRPIPSYLMAMAVGEIGFKPIGRRTGVYATYDMLDRAHYEFADMEKMLEAAEGLYGTYAWGRYDLLILPAAFPFGGMENPMLTFATPTILAGDRSLVALVAHELAHSWSGNLVTNATWNDFWLNEGFTVYFEQRIMEAVYGREHAEMLAALTQQGLIQEEEDIFANHPEDTALQLDLEGRNPDDGLTVIAYDKGYFFLRLIEETTGRERFDKFLNQYFTEHAFQVMDTKRFLDYLHKNLITPEEAAIIDIDAWVYGQRLPANMPKVSGERLTLVDAKTAAWNEGKIKASDLPWDQWVYQERYRFISNLNSTGASPERMKELDSKFNILGTGNYEVLFVWLQKAIENNYTVAYPRVESFLIEVGRRKVLTPLYKAMKATEKEAMAKEIYTKARPGYHAVARQTIDELLGTP